MIDESWDQRRGNGTIRPILYGISLGGTTMGMAQWHNSAATDPSPIVGNIAIEAETGGTMRIIDVDCSIPLALDGVAHNRA